MWYVPKCWSETLAFSRLFDYVACVRQYCLRHIKRLRAADFGRINFMIKFYSAPSLYYVLFVSRKYIYHSCPNFNST